jgi:hypothetical protein
MEWIIFFQLILAHIIGDFIFQSKAWVQDKQRLHFKAPSLYLHAAIHAVLAYILVANFSYWQIPLFIFTVHLLIDIWKSYQEATLKYFTIDQMLHVSSLLLLTFLLHPQLLGDFSQFLLEPKLLIIVTAYLLVLFPFSFIMDMFTARWRKEIRAIEAKDELGSLEDAGKNIGMLERFLVLTFIISGNASAIGLLIAAKSILRFNDLKGESSRKMSEYVLIGTLLSFSLCIATGLLTNYLIEVFTYGH